MKNTLKMFFVLCILIPYPLQVNASENSSPILFIYDASGSMWGQMNGKTKKEIAANVLLTVIGNLPDNQQLGLLAYGHRKKEDCDDVELMVDLTNLSKEKVSDAVKGINPLGQTPLARSASIALDALRQLESRATIIMITDGIESCDGNICEVVSTAKLDGIDFRLHIVGFGLKEGESEQLKCAAAAGGGQYYDAADASGLGTVLENATAATVDDPPGNFSIYATKNGDPVDAWVKAFKAGTREEVDGSRTYRDSAHMYLPAGQYDIDIKPLENTDISGTTIHVDIKSGEAGHHTVSFDGASLHVFTTNNNEGCDALVKMYDKATGAVATSTRTYSRSKTVEVNPGTYDITFEALAVKGVASSHKVENLEIKAGETKTISHNFETGLALIGVKTAQGVLIDATINIHDASTGKNVAAGRTYTSANSNPRQFVLSPGNYKVKIVTLGAHKGNSQTVDVTISTGETVEKIIIY